MIDVDHVVYRDPSKYNNVLAATPRLGKAYATITVGHGMRQTAPHTLDGDTRTIVVEPGNEMSIVRRLADQLRGVRPEGSGRTIVADRGRIVDLGLNIGISEQKLVLLLQALEAEIK